jgi:hypothetical protein
MSAAPAPLNDLVTKIRGAHPGAYDDMDDATLTKSVLAKYPQYSDLAAPKIKPPANPIDKAEPDVAGLAYNIAAPVVKNAYQVSAPGIASSLLKDKAPSIAEHLPEAMTENATPAEELPALMMAGEPGAPSEGSAPPAPKSNPGVIGRVSRVLANRIPGVKLGSDLLDAVKGPEPPVPVIAKPAPAVPPIRVARPEPAVQTVPVPEAPRVGSMKFPATAADRMETKGIQEQMRDAGEREDRMRLKEEGRAQAARTIVNNPKGIRVEEANRARGVETPEQPVKYTKTPGIKSASPKVAPTPANADLEQLIQQSLAKLRSDRAKFGNAPR